MSYNIKQLPYKKKVLKKNIKNPYIRDLIIPACTSQCVACACPRKPRTHYP